MSSSAPGSPSCTTTTPATPVGDVLRARAAPPGRNGRGPPKLPSRRPIVVTSRDVLGSPTSRASPPPEAFAPLSPRFSPAPVQPPPLESASPTVECGQPLEDDFACHEENLWLDGPGAPSFNLPPTQEFRSTEGPPVHVMEEEVGQQGPTEDDLTPSDDEDEAEVEVGVGCAEGLKFKTKKTAKARKEEQANALKLVWKSEEFQSLMNYLTNEVELGNKRGGGFTAAAYNNCEKGLLLSHPDIYEGQSDPYQGQGSLVPQELHLGQGIEGENGAGWENNTVTLPDAVWADLIEANSEVKKWKGKAFECWDEAAKCFDGTIATGGINFPIMHEAEDPEPPHEPKEGVPDWEANGKRKNPSKDEAVVSGIGALVESTRDIVLALREIGTSREKPMDNKIDAAIKRLAAFEMDMQQVFKDDSGVNYAVFYEAKSLLVDNPSQAKLFLVMTNQEVANWLFRLKHQLKDPKVAPKWVHPNPEGI